MVINWFDDKISALGCFNSLGLYFCTSFSFSLFFSRSTAMQTLTFLFTVRKFVSSFDSNVTDKIKSLFSTCEYLCARQKGTPTKKSHLNEICSWAQCEINLKITVIFDRSDSNSICHLRSLWSLNRYFFFVFVCFDNCRFVIHQIVSRIR